MFADVRAAAVRAVRALRSARQRQDHVAAHGRGALSRQELRLRRLHEPQGRRASNERAAGYRYIAHCIDA